MTQINGYNCQIVLHEPALLGKDLNETNQWLSFSHISVVFPYNLVTKQDLAFGNYYLKFFSHDDNQGTISLSVL